MRIGLILPTFSPANNSLVHVYSTVIESLQQEHKLIYRAPGYAFQSEERQKDMLKDMLLSCDVLLGRPEADMTLQVRQDINKHIPYFCFMEGCLPRGNTSMMNNYHLFRTTDVLLINSASDLEIANNFFENAQTRLLPFAFKESEFYPLDEASKQDFRARLGFTSEDKILLYSGRINLEKNVHSILRIFSVIQKLVANTSLIIAGRCQDLPFREFGVYSVSMKRTMERIIGKLGISQDRIRFIGHKNTADLCALYNIADVVINLTLNHDENFGLSQVEAMACGTPVIAADWGGLKDTIVDGETGYKVKTVVTNSGIKVNWWEAVKKIVSLLHNESERQRLGERCVNITHDKYSLSQLRENLRSILAGCQDKKGGVSEPLKASEFARQYWNSRKNFTRPYHLYKELIAPYTGSSRDGAAVDRQLKADQVVCLAAPLIEVDEGSFEINDPIFPLRITIPTEHKKVIRAVIGAMREEPAITVGRLTDNYLVGQADIPEALEWMIEAGLILRGGVETGDLSARSIDSQMSLPLFSVQVLNSKVDIVVLR
jgi:glycosyltransferase involved in cell wall biosynthesis